MRYYITILFLLMVSALEMKAEVDPKFQIYLCFGQSNMAGDAPAEAVDMDVDDRFLVLAAADQSTPPRVTGQWYKATPPLVPQGNSTRVGVADYFGRAMVAALPADYRVGVVEVAVNGADIRGFMSELAAAYNPWGTDYFARYANDPYKRLCDMARIAQQSGVIKGILLHQGEANNGDPQWPQYVKTIYDRLIADLGLNAAEVPLLVGEVVNASENGECAAHNEVIAQVPSVIPTAHVISSYGCPTSGGLHFSIQGYRMMGKRYAVEMLRLLGLPTHIQANSVLDEGLRKICKATSIDSYSSIDLLPDNAYRIPVVTAHFEDGHTENVTAEAFLTKVGNGVTVNGTELKAVTNERSLVTVNYTDFTGDTLSRSFYVNKSGSPLGMIADVVNRILNGDKSVTVADIVRIINDK